MAVSGSRMNSFDSVTFEHGSPLLNRIRALGYHAGEFSVAAAQFFGDGRVPFLAHHDKARVRNQAGSVSTPILRDGALVIKVLPALVKDGGVKIRAFLRTQTAQNNSATYRFDAQANEIILESKLSSRRESA